MREPDSGREIPHSNNPDGEYEPDSNELEVSLSIGIWNYLFLKGLFVRFVKYFSEGTLFGDLLRIDLYNDVGAIDRVIRNYFDLNRLFYRSRKSTIDPLIREQYQVREVEISYNDWLYGEFLRTSFYLGYHSPELQNPHTHEGWSIDEEFSLLFEKLVNEIRKKIEEDLFNGETAKKHYRRKMINVSTPIEKLEDFNTGETDISDFANWLYFEFHDRLWDDSSSSAEIENLKAALRNLNMTERKIIFSEWGHDGELSKRLGMTPEKMRVTRLRIKNRLKNILKTPS